MTNEVQGIIKKQETAEVDIVPSFAITLEESEKRLKLFQSFVKRQMREGVDYGRIPGIPKPTLFKAGAEKLTSIYGLAPHFDIVDQVKDWEKGIFHYQMKCRLISIRNGFVMAEGIGSCNSKERRYRNQDAFTIDNTILKMAKKRALVDAVLTATRASGYFTQDIEDIDISPKKEVKKVPIKEENKIEPGPATAYDIGDRPGETVGDQLEIDKKKKLIQQIHIKNAELKKAGMWKNDSYVKFLEKQFSKHSSKELSVKQLEIAIDLMNKILQTNK